MLRHMPLLLIGLFLCIFFFGSYVPLEMKSFLYALSLSLKQIIIFFLPFIIFSLIFKTTINFSTRATKLIFFILLAVCCSNYFTTLLSYSVATSIYNINLQITLPDPLIALHPSWSFEIPKFISNDKAMLLGVFSGLFMSRFYEKNGVQVSNLLNKLTEKFLNILIYVIPFFITGFVIKLESDGALGMMASHYSIIFITVALTQVAYIVFLYFVDSSFHFPTCLKKIKNILPAAVTGLSTMSSAAALPFTIVGAEKNSNDPEVSKAVIPATVNIHLIGDCIAIPIFAYAILKSFHAIEPTFLTYCVFAFYFMMAKFSVAAIPGGGILVMLPILESYLGLTGEMMSLITALYLLFDPVITCANIMGNGVFATLFARIFAYVNKGEKTFHVK